MTILWTKLLHAIPSYDYHYDQCATSTKSDNMTVTCYVKINIQYWKTLIWRVISKAANGGLEN